MPERARQVLQLLAESRTVWDIAVRLAISHKTVQTYRTRLMEKSGIHDLPGLVRFAVQRELLTLE